MPALRSISRALSRVVLAGPLLASSGACSATPTLYVGVASSLEAATSRWLEAFDARHPEIRIVPVADSSRRLARQLRDGAPYDVYISARAELAEALADEGVLTTPTTLGHAELALAVPAAARHADVDEVLDSLKVLSIADVSVPLGDATARWIRDRRPELADDPRIRSLEGSARAVASRLDTGTCDAAIVYAHQCLPRARSWRCIRLDVPATAVVVAAHAAANHPDLAAAIVNGLDGATLGLTPTQASRADSRGPT